MQTLREILYFESSVAKTSYPTLSLEIKPELGFNTWNKPRKYGPNNAYHAINGLLNYGFGIFAMQNSKAIKCISFDFYYGFHRRDHESHLALVYEMIEPFVA